MDDVGRPEIGIVYDIYHSAVMGERTEEVIGDRIGHVLHCHIADHRGRNEPGSGRIDLKHRLDWLCTRGYAGAIGLEFVPTGNTEDAIRAVERALA